MQEAAWPFLAVEGILCVGGIRSRLLVPRSYLRPPRLSKAPHKQQAQLPRPIGFETPIIVDPSTPLANPTSASTRKAAFRERSDGNRTQRSVWLGSVDGGHTSAW